MYNGVLKRPNYKWKGSTIAIQKNGLNLTHITYRPSKVDKWNYSFFFDFEGHKDDKKVKSLLEELNATDAEIKLLGSYPKAEN